MTRRFGQWVLICALALDVSYGQTATSEQTAVGSEHFDVSSVRLVDALPNSTNRASFRSDPNRILFHLIGIKNLFLRAWPVADYEVVWPSWVNSQPSFYDVEATFPAGTTVAQLQIMLQTMLADRFGLAFHWEDRNSKTFALVISQRGLKATRAHNPPESEAASVISYGLRKGMWSLTGSDPSAPGSGRSGLTIARLTRYINENSMLDRPLVDLTYLDGYYEVNLLIPSDPPPDDAALPLSERQPNRLGGPALMDALDKQLGLKVEPRTLTVRTLVIDHLDRVPSQN